jgi:3-deoxy-7-phosphoheptulonate synthase
VIILLSKQVSDVRLTELCQLGASEGFRTAVSHNEACSAIALYGKGNPELAARLQVMEDVSEVVLFKKPYPLSSRQFQPHDTLITAGDITLGADQLTVIAGPGKARTPEQWREIAAALRASGVQIMRGEFVVGNEEGMDLEGLRAFREAAMEYGLLTMATVPGPAYVEQTAQYADIIAAGVRNMQNRDLHRELGDCGKPVILRRSLSATYEEFLNAAEYIVACGNKDVMLMERGIRTFEPYTSQTLDIGAIPALQSLSHLPVIVDATHASGRSDMIEPLTRAAVAAGASGVFIGFDLPFAAEDNKPSLTLSPIVGKRFDTGA